MLITISRPFPFPRHSSAYDLTDRIWQSDIKANANSPVALLLHPTKDAIQKPPPRRPRRRCCKRQHLQQGRSVGPAYPVRPLIPPEYNAVPAWRDWDNSQLERWLTDHKVPNPGAHGLTGYARLLEIRTDLLTCHLKYVQAGSAPSS